MIGDYDTVRFVLHSLGNKTLVVVGCNPSTASDLVLDNTMQNTIKIAEYNAYDGLAMINLYPQRISSPDNLHTTLDETMHTANLNEIKNFIQSLGKVDVMLAYGGLLHKRKYLTKCLTDILDTIAPFTDNIYCFGVNKDGTPKHPCPRTGLPSNPKLMPYQLRG